MAKFSLSQEVRYESSLICKTLIDVESKILRQNDMHTQNLIRL